MRQITGTVPPPLPFFRSIQWRLPLLIALLMAAMIAAFAWIAHREVKQAFFRAGGDRARGAAEQLADLLGSARQKSADLRRVAADPAIRAYLQAPSPDTLASADVQLSGLAGAGAQTVELWRGREPVLRHASSPTIEGTFPRDLPPAGALVRLDQPAPKLIVSTLAEPVAPEIAGQAPLGFVVLRRPISTGATTDLLNRLMGSGARLELGGEGSESWTDVAGLVPPPPIDLAWMGPRDYVAADGTRRIGALSPVTGTPWLVWVSFPSDPVAVQARAFLKDILLIAGLFVVLAGLGGAAIASRISRPLSALTTASAAIAAGDFDRRVTDSRTDELGRLGASFNAMVTQIRAGREMLVERARHANASADVANALTGAEDLRGELQHCAEALVEHLDAAQASIWTVHAVEPVLELQATAGLPLDAAQHHVRIGEGEIGTLSTAADPMLIPDIRHDSRVTAPIGLTGGAPVAFAGYPLYVNDKVVGVMTVFLAGALTDGAVDALASMARAIGLGIERKRLADSREQLANILDTASDFVTIGRPAAPPTYINRAARRALGIGDTERVDLLMAYRPSGFKAFFDTVVLPTATREGSWSGEAEYVARSGRVIPVSQVSVIHRDDTGGVAYLSTIARDISDRRLAETALRESESRFRRITETIAEVFWILDIESSRVIYVSPGYERIWGRTCASLYDDPQSFSEAVHPDDLAQVQATLAREQIGQPFDHEYRIRRPDGEIRWIWDRGFPVPEPNGRVLQYVGAAQDITERKRADEQVQLLALAVESSNEMVSVTGLDGRFTFANRAFLQTYGYALEDVLGQTTALLRPPKGASEVFDQMIADTVRGGFQGEVPHRRRDGSEVLVSLNTSLIRDHEGRAVGYLAVARDISGRRLLEEQLRQSQRMDAVGQLAGGIAHDFNNLLTAIHGFAGLLSESLPAEGTNRSDLAQIQNAADRASSLTRQLLAFSRKQILAPHVLRLGEVVGELMPMLQRLLGENINLKTIISDRSSVKADTGQLEQVLVNLCVNARDAMPDGGHLTIETADVVLDETYAQQHADVRSGQYVVLAVSDSGHGMDAATQRRVFEPFFTTKPVGHGTGLGLATVHGIIRQSGGHIWVYSEVGRGTTFKVYLPRTLETREVSLAAAKEADQPRGTETILLVEDEAVVRDFVQRVLTRRGYEIHAMSEPATAMAFAQGHRGTIHLVLTDVVLPEMNGRALAGQLQAVHPESRVLYMSGYTDDAIIHHGVLEPGMWFLQKPFTAAGLAKKVRDLLDT